MDGGVLFGMVFVSVLGLSAAQTKHCCTPDQWQGLMNLTVTAQWGSEYAVNYLSYDYTNRRVVSFWNINDSPGQVSSFEILELYNGPNSGIQYSLDFKTRKCLVQKLPDPFTKICVPDFAQKVGDLTLGAATESLPVTLYSIPGQNRTDQNFITVTRDLCIPVSVVSAAQGEGHFSMSVSGFADIQLGITHPSVFDVPSECKGAKPWHSDKFSDLSAKASFTRRFFYL